MARRLMIAVATLAWLSCGTITFGQGGGHGGRRGGDQGGGSSESPDRRKTAADYYHGKSPPPKAMNLTPHGGQYLETESNRYEIVYCPLQTRIYLFDSKSKPVSARDVHAQMSFKIPQESVARTIPFQHVAMPAGSAEQDYVAAPFDMRQLPDQDTPLTFVFSGLANRRRPTATFTPVFSPAKIRPYVARVLLTEADREGVMRQRVCPVSGQFLGTRGQIIKLYIADFPLYLSGDDCVAEVMESPEKYLPQPAGPTARR